MARSIPITTATPTLDGGMHFTGAVAAGEELCQGIGTAGFEYASDLIGGEW